MVTVRLEPEGEELHLEKATSVMQVLKKLGLKPTQALVIRDQGLLTYDVAVKPGDTLTIRRVTSRG